MTYEQRLTDAVLAAAIRAWRSAPLTWPSPDALDEHKDNEQAAFQAMRKSLADALRNRR